MEYKLEDHVRVQYKKYEPSRVVDSIIVGIKRMEFRFGYNPIEYCCSPLELEGLEHDDEEWVPASHMAFPTITCTPRILGYV